MSIENKRIPVAALLASLILFANVQVALAKGGKEQRSSGSLRQDLVLHYSFDDDMDGKVYDESGLEHHGYTVGSVGYEESFRGNAVKLSSKSTYVLSDAKGLNMHGWKAATMSIWFKTNRTTTYARLMNRGDISKDNQGGMSMQAGSSLSKASMGMLRQFRSNPPVHERLYTSSLFPKNFDRVGKWVHMVGVFDGQYLRIYLDGKLDRYAEVSSEGIKIWDPSNSKLVIGTSANKSRMSWSDKYFDGLIDEVKIWKRALTAEEVAKLHKKTWAN